MPTDPPPETYKQTHWIWQDCQMKKKEITFIQRLYSRFDKVLADAATETIGHVKVDMDVSRNRIAVWNNCNIHRPVDVFKTLPSMDDLLNLVTVGRDILYNRKVFLIYDPHTMLKPEFWMVVLFQFNLAEFGVVDCVDVLEDTFALMKRRVVDLAGCLKGVKVELDGTHVQLETFEDYAMLYLGTSSKYLSIYEHVKDGLEICVVVDDGNCEQVSFVNNIATKAGPLVNYITDQITSYLGKILNLEPNYIKRHLWVFVNAAFYMQTEENLMKGSFRSKFKLTPHFLKKLANKDVTNRLLSYADFKDNQELKKNNGTGEWKLYIPGLVDANYAATTCSENCTLILAQGDSAKAFALGGLSVVGQDYYGIYSLKGNLLNVREARNEVLSNTDIQRIMKILGLEYDKFYENVKELRYGRLMILADQDHEGSLFKGLLINFFHFFWPSLLKVPNFMFDFIPPIVKASTKETTRPFYSMAEYEAWKKTLENKATEYKIKYRKGLASSEPEEVEEYFADLTRYTKEFVWDDDEDGDAIKIAFDKMKIEETKYRLQAHQAGHSKEHIRYRDFINKELFVFSNQISIPSIVDGLNLHTRKILFCAFKKPITEKIQVSKFSRYVSWHSAYHDHASLVEPIIGMAQNYVGSNNINLLQPNGHFGTRLMGGKDHSRARDISTQLSPITRYIFLKSDEHLLNYLNDNGQSIEPAWFIPIIPMVLVNGVEAIGTGWSSFIPKYDPRDIIDNLILLLKGEAVVPMKPWYKCYEGVIQEEKSGQYEEILQAAIEDGKDKTPFIKDYRACNDAENVNFEIAMTEDQMNTAKKEGLWKKFGLTTRLSTANMHLFDEHGVIKKYDTPEQILKEFFDIRLRFYKKRGTAKLCELEKDLKLLKNKEMYIDLVFEGKIKPLNRTCTELIKELEENGLQKETEAEEVVPGTGYHYLLSMDLISFTKEKIEELKHKKDDKQKEVDALKIVESKFLWLSELLALKEQLSNLDGYYISAKSTPEIAEAAQKKSPAKRTAAKLFTTTGEQEEKTLPQRANKKRRLIKAVSDSDEEPEDDNNSTRILILRMKCDEQVIEIFVWFF